MKHFAIVNSAHTHCNAMKYSIDSNAFSPEVAKYLILHGLLLLLQIQES